jgi:hypothetical protein
VSRLVWRPPALVLGLLGYVYDAEAPIPWDEAVEVFTTEETPYKTVEATLYDLIAFGALHRIGAPAGVRGKTDTRALKATDLGRAWIAGEILVVPTLDK